MKVVGGTFCTGDRGFSLVEVITVLAISSLVVVLALPSVGAFSRRHSAETAARELLLAMRQARWQAISSGWPARVAIFPRTSGSPARYAVEGEDAGGWFPVGAARSLDGSVCLALTGPSKKYFYPNGTCSMGSVLLTGEGGARWRLSLNAATGRTRLYCEEGRAASER